MDRSKRITAIACFCRPNTEGAIALQVATAKGDYTVKQRHTFSYQYVYGILLGMQQAAITWVCSTCVKMLLIACLGSLH